MLFTWMKDNVSPRVHGTEARGVSSSWLHWQPVFHIIYVCARYATKQTQLAGDSKFNPPWIARIAASLAPSSEALAVFQLSEERFGRRLGQRVQQTQSRKKLTQWTILVSSSVCIIFHHQMGKITDELAVYAPTARMSIGLTLVFLCLLCLRWKREETRERAEAFLE